MLFATEAERAREQTHELENMQQDECVVQKSGVRKRQTKNATPCGTPFLYETESHEVENQTSQKGNASTRRGKNLVAVLVADVILWWEIFFPLVAK